MLTTKVRVQVLAFIVIALTAVAFVGANYAGLGALFGGDERVIRLQLAEGGGLFTNGEVTYRGVAIGRVGELRLTEHGMEAELRIDDSGPPIPVNSEAVVANRSAVGEQYVDLRPRTDGGPYLGDGAVIPKESTQVPLGVDTMLGNLRSFSDSVPTDALRTVVDEFYLATKDSGANLQVLLDTAQSFTRTAAQHLPQTTTLIADGATVLNTQFDSAEEWRSFAGNAKLFAGELARADGDLRRLIAQTPGAVNELGGLLRDTDPDLSILLANLLTTANLFDPRTAGAEQLYSMFPKAVAATSTAVNPQNMRFSMALTFFEPPPCTSGYGTPYRQGENTADAPLNTGAHCAVPRGDPRLVRGSQNAPSPGVPPAAVPGAGPLSAPALPKVSTSLEEMLWLPK